ncbi:MAG: hypothetical protein ACJAS3_001340 [Roseivirga sp.]|jgi:hypothetical protein
MNSVGTYSCTARGAKLEIRAIKNQNGDASGTFSMGGISLPISLYHHFEGNAGPSTVMQ